ncbi:Delta(24(24(1)))-sterol reductase like protein, partial [Hortaea werneckii]
MTVTRSQTGKTPRKSGVPDGFVETPGTKRRSGKAGSSERSPSPLDDKTTNGHSTARNNEATSAKKSTVNGAGKGMNGAPKGRVIDGWLEGSDPKIDVNPHFDFGGTPGVTAMMIGFPLLMWYMWIGATYYDGKFPSEPNMTWSEFGKHLFNLAYNGSFPHLKAWAIYWIFFLTQGIFYLTLPGVYSMGKPLPHEGGKQLRYYNNAVYSFYLTNAIAAVLHFTGLFKLYTLIDEFGPLMSVAIISGFLVAIVAYVSALWRGKQHRMTGHHIYDFFMGAELNPRMFGWLDFKMF